MDFAKKSEAFSQPAREKMMNLDQDFDRSVRRLQELWQGLEPSQIAPKQGIIKVVEELCQVLKPLASQRALSKGIVSHSDLLEREYLLWALQERIHQSRDLNEILKTTVAEIQQFMRSDRVLICQVTSDEKGIVVAESVSPSWSSLLGMQVGTDWFKERLISHREGNKIIVNNVNQLNYPAEIQEFLQQQDLKAYLAVPILHEQNFWGLLIVHQCSEPRQWQALEVEVLQRLATQLAIAIHQSELHQQLKQLNTDLEQQVQYRTYQLEKALNFEALIKRIADKLRDSLDESHILQTAVEELGQVLEVNCCDAAIYDLEQKTSTICYEYTKTLPSVLGSSIDIRQTQYGYQHLLQGQDCQFCNFDTNIRDTLAVLACAIFDNQGVVGDLRIFKSPDSMFDDSELRLVRQVANQCAIALRQARLYQEAQAQVQELEKLNHLKDDFLSTVSHELRTPVTNMKMAIQMLAIALNREQPLFVEFSKPLSEQSRIARYFQILQNECEREAKLITDLLDLQRLEAGSQVLLPTVIQLSDWLVQVVEPFRERMQTRQQHLQLNIPEYLPVLMYDSTALGRIFSELLNNACKYTPPDENIIITAKMANLSIQIQIINTGIEIPIAELPLIFNKFYRIPNADRWKQGGTGLGLALVQKLATYLGAKIAVESNSDRTCFTVTLPLS